MSIQLQGEKLEMLHHLEFQFGHGIITAGDFRAAMLELGFNDFDVDEYIDDAEATEP